MASTTRMQHTRRAMIAASMLVLAAHVSAQGSPQGESSGKGFLFGPPTGTITVHLGYALANAGSDLFAFTTRELTINRRDFSSLDYGAEVGLRITDRIDATLSGDWSGMSKRSEFRDWLDNNDRPIEQETEFQRASFAIGLKYYFLPNGQSLGRLAWIPTRYSPFVGAGVGKMNYRFKQHGDFIDHANGERVFTDTFTSESWANTAYLLAGVQWTLNERFALTTHAKYELANAELGRDFSGFNRIDLSGINAGIGLTLRY